MESSKLPRHIDALKPYEIFDLFLTEGILAIISDANNEYADRAIFRQQAGGATPHQRLWKKTSTKEVGVSTAILIWMGLHVEDDVESFWNRNGTCGPIHAKVIAAMSLVRFQQVQRHFHILSL